MTNKLCVERSLLVLACLTLGSCGNPGVLANDSIRLTPELAWYGDNRARLDAMIDEYGRGGAKYDAEHPPCLVRILMDIDAVD